MGIKSAVKEWMSETFNNWVKQPIVNATEKYENQASEQINKYSAQAKTQIKKPGDYYWKQEAFYRGLFWIAVGLLVVLWIISGS
ncbi:MAG: hypothetical protein I3273_03925 [Candidatus Moeniiplasma glomeromycotorum]|nr:hypothetical protein [Candidatus Moeniiplasma glomeromycotorum]MCE8167693.1 hypothetical protein [Candidatus Moeniiplasma glomeromycotorum]MCE8169242.1 hypothetical protein [Candidatus Moeniiplasma glomeromycotorum]